MKKSFFLFIIIKQFYIRYGVFIFIFWPIVDDIILILNNKKCY